MKKIAALVVLALAGLAAAFGLASTGDATPPTTTTTTGGGHTPVTICHKPGTPAEHEITVDDSSILDAHLAHGDTLGPCPPDETTTTDTETTTTTETETTTTTTTETQPPRERCPPGMTPTAGKDGEPGNDECEFPPTETQPPVTTTTEPPVTTTTEPPVTTTPEPPVTTTVSENPPTVVAPPVKPKPPKKSGPPKKPKPPKMPPVCSASGVETNPCAVPGSG